MKCPGQDTRYWKQNSIYDEKCPKCGSHVEFFKDDTIRKCKNCKYKFLNPSMNFGCASYCEYAAECIGNIPSELLEQKEDLFKNRIAIETKKYLKTNFKLISHAIRVSKYAEDIGKNELNSNLVVILSAAYLYDIELSIAKRILEKLNAKSDILEEICNLIKQHPNSKETMNYKILHDAKFIANIEDKYNSKLINLKKIENIINKMFLTDSGKKYAKKKLLKKEKVL